MYVGNNSLSFLKIFIFLTIIKNYVVYAHKVV